MTMRRYSLRMHSDCHPSDKRIDRNKYTINNPQPMQHPLRSRFAPPVSSRLCTLPRLASHCPILFSLHSFSYMRFPSLRLLWVDFGLIWLLLLVWSVVGGLGSIFSPTSTPTLSQLRPPKGTVQYQPTTNTITNINRYQSRRERTRNRKSCAIRIHSTPSTAHRRIASCLQSG